MDYLLVNVMHMASVPLRESVFFFGPHFLIFGLNTTKCGPGKVPYLDTFHSVSLTLISSNVSNGWHRASKIKYKFQFLKRL